MTKLQLLNAYLTERLAVVVREILDVVEDTVSEYREETAQTRRENESLRRQLRDVLLVAETDLLGPAQPASLSVPGEGSPAGQQEWSSSLEQEPEPTAAQQNQNRGLTESSWREEKPCGLDSVPVHKTEPELQRPGAGTSRPPPPTVRVRVDVPHLRAVPGARQFCAERLQFSPTLTPDQVKTEPEEADITVTITESDLRPDPGYAHVPETLYPPHDPGEPGCSDASESDETGGRGHARDPQTGEGSERVTDEVPCEDGPSMNPEEERAHQCPQCGKSFSGLNNLRTHLQTHRRPFGCDWCSKAFAQSADLRRHLRTHTGERPHRCTWCAKSFTQRGNLRRHLRIHTGERPYRCPLCAKTFSDGDTLKKHQRTHSGEKPYCCSLCPKSFTVASGLQVHLRKHLRDGPNLYG